MVNGFFEIEALFIYLKAFSKDYHFTNAFQSRSYNLQLQSRVSGLLCVTLICCRQRLKHSPMNEPVAIKLKMTNHADIIW